MRLYRNVFFPFYISSISSFKDKCPHSLHKKFLNIEVPIIVGDDKCKKCLWNAGSVRVSRILEDKEIEFEYIKCTHEVI
jgi:hypothetical protein